MIKTLLPFLLVLIALTGKSFSQSNKDVSVELSAVVQKNPARITLNWVANDSATAHIVYRKLKTCNSWGAVIANLPGAATQFIDSTINVGISYEYRVVRQANAFTGYGYINSGIEIPFVDNRGSLILIVDSTFTDSLSFELARLQDDLEGDGWRVFRIDVPRNLPVPLVKESIKALYTPATKAVFLVGHVPVPYSGEINVDGHTDHTGAYPADVYYADMNGSWTDALTNNITASDPRNRNVPEDGKFDQ